MLMSEPGIPTTRVDTTHIKHAGKEKKLHKFQVYCEPLFNVN